MTDYDDIYFIQKLLGKKKAAQFEAMEFDPLATAEMWKMSKGNVIVFRAYLLNAIKQSEEAQEVEESA